MVRNVCEWFEFTIFLAMVPFLPVTWLFMYSLMERFGF